MPVWCIWAKACSPVFSRYPSWAVLAAGGWGMALTSPGPVMSRGLGSLWHRQPHVAPWHGPISLSPSQGSCAYWDHQRARSPSHPIFPVGVRKSSVSPQVRLGCGRSRAQLTAPVLFLVSEMASQGMCPGVSDVGGKLPFSSVGSKCWTPGFLEEERWKE